MNRGAILVALLLVSPACKKKRATSSLVIEYRDRVCACKDVACADMVNEDFRRRVQDEKPSDEKVDEALQRQIQECVTKVNGAGSDSATASGSGGSAGPSKPELPSKREADALINAARTWQKHPKIAVSEIYISYVDAAGLLDGEFGAMQVAFGATHTPLDDPKRKTGAPVKVDDTLPTSCPTLYLQANGWATSDSFCPDVASYIPKCTVVEIWKRAIKGGAPNNALAVIAFKNTAPPSWSFSITDTPRDVHISNVFPDDCERTLEKP